MKLRYLGIMAILALVVGYGYAAPLLLGQVQTAPSPSSPVTSVPGTLPTVQQGQPSQSVVAVTSVPSPAEPQHVPEQVIWALAMSYGMQFLKKKGWLSFLTEDATSRAKSFMGFVLAACTATGIHFAITGSLIDGTAAISITGLSLTAFKDVGFQWIAQQGWYDLVVKKASTQRRVE